MICSLHHCPSIDRALPAFLSPFSTLVFRRRWRKISPAKNLSSFCVLDKPSFRQLLVKGSNSRHSPFLEIPRWSIWWYYHNIFLYEITCLGIAVFLLKAVFHCRRFARAGGATDFNIVKNQSRAHTKKVKCSSTSKRVRAHKSGRKKLKLVRSARAGKMTAMENGLKNGCRIQFL